jgi:hypothetical protein
LCQHLEVNEIGRYSVAVGEGQLQQIMLLRCSSCLRYITMDGSEVPSGAVVSRENMSRAKMRTVTALLNGDVHKELEELVASETGGGDSSKIINEIVALGLKQYKHTLG